jgi:hypothetical protein
MGQIPHRLWSRQAQSKYQIIYHRSNFKKKSNERGALTAGTTNLAAIGFVAADNGEFESRPS